MTKALGRVRAEVGTARSWRQKTREALCFWRSLL